MDEFLAVVKLFAGTFTPRGWMECDGRILQISSNTALFSLLGTTYGGNGSTTFALPDLRGRVAVGQGQGPGLRPIQLGERNGVETVTLMAAQVGVAPVAVGNDSKLETKVNVLTAAAAQPHENRQPYLGLRYIICVQGLYPSRD